MFLMPLPMLPKKLAMLSFPELLQNVIYLLVRHLRNVVFRQTGIRHNEGIDLALP